MTLDDVITAFKVLSVGDADGDIAEISFTNGHEAVSSFFHGMEKDLDPINELAYPVIFLMPFNITPDVNAGQFAKTYSIVMQCVDQLPEDRTTDQITEALHKTDQILDHLLIAFIDNFQGKERTMKGIKRRFDFSFTTAPTKAPLADFGTTNVTGFEMTFAITAQYEPGLCDLTDVIT